jgi:hypothetical protein
VPETPRIAAYPRVSEIGAFRRATTKPLQAAIFDARPASKTGLIAMQKVIGSNWTMQVM